MRSRNSWVVSVWLPRRWPDAPLPHGRLGERVLDRGNAPVSHGKVKQRPSHGGGERNPCVTPIITLAGYEG